MKYSEIIRLNRELEGKLKEAEYKIVILSNIMVHQSKEICEYSLRIESVNANVLLGGYDNIVQDSSRFQDANAIIIFWEMYNFIDGLQYKIDNLSEREFKSIIEKIKIEIDLVLNSLDTTPLVLINKFSSLIFDRYQLSTSRLNQLKNLLNQYLEGKAPANIKLVDIDSVIACLSIDSSVDLRYYYSSKTLYSIDFYRKYFEHIKPIFLSATGKIKKALIFDCDNTLWKGILGEDGLNKIKPFQEIQFLALNLAKKGVVLGLCSKNNLNDVDGALKNHPDMILRDDSIVIKKINWDDKVSNLRSIAQELNLGLDSLVFIDDSSFEVELIKKELPEVSSFQVPTKEYEYGLMFRKVSNLFYNPSQTREDTQKIEIYKNQFRGLKDKDSAGNIEDYLKTLGLIISVYVDNLKQVSRISQLTQKTNQFNLTTKRYTENEIKNLINSESHSVISIGVSDKYGNNGIVGLAILDIAHPKIDTLLLSCRILGRNIEYKFMDILVSLLKTKGIKEISSQYVKTMKNQQTLDYYNKCRFDVVSKSDDNSQYCLHVDNYTNKNIKYIEVKNGK
jgi:FkbH-like protein